MYGQGNFAQQFRPGHPTHPSQFQQGQLHPQFQQVPPPPPPRAPINHEGFSAGPPHVSHHHSVYQRGPPPPPPLQQGPPPPLQQAPPPPPPPSLQQGGAPRPFMRVFPPPPSQGQMSYFTPQHPPPSFGHGTQYGQLLPPPPSSFVPVTPASFVTPPEPPSELAHPPPMPPPPPPPPPSSPPPPPPPPSPPQYDAPPDDSSRPSITTFSIPLDINSISSQHLDSGSATQKVSDRVLPACAPDDILISRGYSSIDGTVYAMPKVEDTLSSEKQPDLPPPKPAAIETVRQIETLCQYIAKNGSGFEVTVRAKQHGNPKFAFLFGGEPGSEAAVAHEYFQWTKRNCLNEEVKMPNGCEPSKVESSTCQSGHSNEDACDSAAESDMDMEDDSHQFNKKQIIVASTKVSKELEVLNVKELQPGSQCSSNPTGNVSSEFQPRVNIPILAREEKESDHTPVRNSSGASERTLDVITHKPVRPVDKLTLLKASPSAAVHSSSKEVPDSVSNMGSPFRLIQDYASDDSVEADVSTERISPPIPVEETCLSKQLPKEVTLVEINSGSLSVPLHETEFTESYPTHKSSVSIKATKVVDATLVASPILDAIAKTDKLHDDNHDYQPSNDPDHGDSMQGDDGADSQSGKHNKKNENQGSPALKVDEFGRMVRKNASDSDSEKEHYSGRRHRRGRSRSPLDRRSRSPRRRNEKRNRSRSWSPRKRRSMSKSRSPPSVRHKGEFSGEKSRRDRDQTDFCFDFQKGRCYRGASCRFSHHRQGDSVRRYRGRQDWSINNARGDSRSRSEYDIVKEDATRTEDSGWDKKTVAGTLVDDALPVSLVESQEEIERRPEKEPALETPIVQDAEISTLTDEVSRPLLTSELSIPEMSGRPPSEPSLADNAVHHPLQANGNSLENTGHSLLAEHHLPVQTIDTSHSLPPVRELRPPQLSGDSYQFQHSQLPPPPPPPPPATASTEMYPPYQASTSGQHSQSPAISKPSWTSLPLPPPPPPNMHVSTSTTVSQTQGFHPLQFQQYPGPGPGPGPMMRPYQQHGQPSNSQAIDQHLPTYPPTSEFHRPPLHSDGIRPNQQFDYPNAFRDERFPQSSVLDGNRYHHSTPLQPLPMHPPRDERHYPHQVHDTSRNFQSLPPNQSFPDGNSYHNPFPKEHTFTQHHPQQPTFGLQWPTENAGPSMRKYPLGVDDESIPPLLAPRITTHYNPYASTFEKVPIPDSNKSQGQILPKSGNPYDPLYDSIEPSSKADKIEEKEATSPENDEFGETGAVESDDSPDDDKPTGDVEIDDQARSKNKSKKSKSKIKGMDSRSTKVFKVALAEFVKDVLKPSWRQGNMSKEAFKTIVKKTVDKVANAMKSHQIPKGQAKIDQYVESSQRKLTKLVMGYVDKYVKG
ncbi:hypothetical protein ACHQM5_006654 [Ranunculus cassubicifolius]